MRLASQPCKRTIVLLNVVRLNSSGRCPRYWASRTFTFSARDPTRAFTARWAAMSMSMAQRSACGHPMRRQSRRSATGTNGMPATARCVLARIPPAYGRDMTSVCSAATGTSTGSSARMAERATRRIRSRFTRKCRREPRHVHGPWSTSGATAPGLRSARVATVSPRRCRSTKCTSDRGGAPSTTHSQRIGTSHASSRSTSPSRDSRMSSCCR